MMSHSAVADRFGLTRIVQGKKAFSFHFVYGFSLKKEKKSCSTVRFVQFWYRWTHEIK